MKKKYLESIILLVVKSLYNIIETKNHLFATYLNSYNKKPKMKILFYDIYFFITKDSGENFDIKNLQIHNNFNIRTDTFMKEKSKQKLKQF